MGDLRFERPLGSVKHATDPGAAIHSLSDVDVIAALAAASRDQEPYLANVLATEALNRVRRTRAITDNIGEGVFAVDARLRVTFLNATAEHVLGWRQAELSGARVDTLIASPALVEAVLEGGGTERCEVAELLRKDGCAFAASLTISAIREPGSTDPAEIEGVVVVFQDMSARRDAETRMNDWMGRLMRQNQAIERLTNECNDTFDESMTRVVETLARTLETDRVGVWVYDGTSRSLRCHALHERTKSPPPPSALTLADAPEFFDSLDTGHLIDAPMACLDPRTAGLSESYLAPNNVCSMLAAAIHVGRDWRGALIVEQMDESRPWHDDEQRFIASVASFVATLMVARERRRAERALQERENFHEAVMNVTDRAGTGVAVYADVHGVPRLQFANQAARALLGVDSDAAMARFWDAFGLHQGALQQTFPRSFSTVILREDGTQVPIHVGVREAPFDGEPALIIAFHPIEIPREFEEARP